MVINTKIINYRSHPEIICKSIICHSAFKCNLFGLICNAKQCVEKNLHFDSKAAKRCEKQLIHLDDLTLSKLPKMINIEIVPFQKLAFLPVLFLFVLKLRLVLQ